MLDAIDKGEGPTILGDGSEAFDFIAVEDCALANICAMQADTTDQNYNIGTGIRTSLKELAEIILKITSSDKKILFKPRSQATLVKNRVGDPYKAIKELNFKAKINLENGLKKLIKWRSEHKAKLDKENQNAGTKI